MATTDFTPTAAPPAEVMSWEDFEKLPDGDGYHRELIEGELQILPPVKLGHSKLAKRIFKALLTAEEAAKGQAYFEAGFKLGQDPASWVQPDVSFVRGQRVEDTEDSGYLLGAPELAVEVVSPSESASDLSRKVELMLATGSLAVWVVYPRQRKVHINLPDGSSLRRGIGDTLALPELLPGWELPVAKLFED
jgi:Uma2 family endonuclease